MVNMNDQTKEFWRNVIVPPGEHIQEMIDERDWTQKELARRMGRPVQTINEIINGKRAITAETALQLEEALGLSAQTWMNFESSYRLALARKRRPPKDVGAEVFRAYVNHFTNETEDPWIALKTFIDDISIYGPPQQVISSTCASFADSRFTLSITEDEAMIDRFKKFAAEVDPALSA